MSRLFERLKLEWIYFWTALMFFTRIPIPFHLPYSNEIMNQSQKYYSWTGLVVGSLNAIVFYIAQLIFSIEIAIILSMGVSVLLTGAFHEDGFTDVCDSFGGGYGKEKIMTIMKDSRVGAYGAIGIVLLLLLKFFGLLDIASNTAVPTFCTVLIFAHATSRFLATTTIYTHVYVRDIDSSKSKPIADQALPFSALIISVIAIIVPLLLVQKWELLLLFIPGYLAKALLAAYFKKHIGGYTGDCLGAIQQVTEVVIYLSAIVLWKFI